MSQSGKSIAALLVGVLLLSGCSRPVATVQKTQADRFYSPSPAVDPTVNQPADGMAAPVTTAATDPVATGRPVQQQPEAQALASLKATYATNKRMPQRLERVERQLAENSLAGPKKAVATRKTSLIERLTLKKMAKTMQRKLAPKQTKEITGNARLGLIIAAVGLVFLLIGNSLGSILGLIALLAGGALFFYSILQE